MNIAVVDIGSNTVKMKIYGVVDEKINELYSEVNNAKLISYIKEGTLSAEGIFLLCHIISEFKINAKAKNADIFKCFATASLRKTKNIDDIKKAVLDFCQEDIDLVSGKDEAFYSFSGVRNTMPNFPENTILLDMGGGSTEIVQCINGQKIGSESMDFGSLSLYLDFPENSFDCMKEHAVECFKKTKLYPIKATDAVLVGGTALAINKLYGHFYPDASSFNMTFERLKQMYEKLKIYNEDTVVLLTEQVPHRVTTVVSGLSALIGLFEQTGVKNITVSTCGIREGYVYEKILKNMEF